MNERPNKSRPGQSQHRALVPQPENITQRKRDKTLKRPRAAAASTNTRGLGAHRRPQRPRRYREEDEEAYRYKRPKNLDEKGKYVLQETINCVAVRPIRSVRFTPSGRHLALGSADAIGRFCQRKNGKWEVVLLFDEHEEGINDIQFFER